MQSRSLKPELLDVLPPESCDALHSRRDLVRFNRAMGNPAWFGRALARSVLPSDHLLELGAGTGELGASLKGRAVPWDGLDLAPRPARWPPEARWHRTDVRAFTGWPDYSVIVANLFFHHFNNQELGEIGTHLDRHARIILACEPARARLWQWAFRALCLLVRANHVSRHDGHVSIAAGFLGDELPHALGLAPDRWTWTATVSCRGAYRLTARRTR